VSDMTRRDWLALTLGSTAALALQPGDLFAQPRLLTRTIPSSGEMLPVIGLGSSATFSQVARKEDATALREVLQALVNGGARVFDTDRGQPTRRRRRRRLRPRSSGSRRRRST
jgi:hypothetical protein